MLLRRGDVDRAEEVLGRLSGPRTSLVRSHIALRRGDVTAARAALLAAAPALHGEEAVPEEWSGEVARASRLDLRAPAEALSAVAREVFARDVTRRRAHEELFAAISGGRP